MSRVQLPKLATDTCSLATFFPGFIRVSVGKTELRKERQSKCSS